eukprot:XP_001704163.1 Hypothetical protein GL50803_25089 [Giardia lamblia ATCC 50803]
MKAMELKNTVFGDKYIIRANNVIVWTREALDIRRTVQKHKQV